MAETDPTGALSTGLYNRPVLTTDPGLHTSGIWYADADAAGTYAVSGADDKTVRIWSARTGILLHTIRLPQGPGQIGRVFAVAISPDGELVAAGGWTRATEMDRQEQIYLFDRGSGALVRRIEGLPHIVNHLAFSPDGRYLAATLRGGKGLRVYGREEDWDEAARDEHYLADCNHAESASTALGWSSVSSSPIGSRFSPSPTILRPSASLAYHREIK